MHYSTSYGNNKMRYNAHNLEIYLYFLLKNELTMNDIYCGESMHLSGSNDTFF